MRGGVYVCMCVGGGREREYEFEELKEKKINGKGETKIAGMKPSTKE